MGKNNSIDSGNLAEDRFYKELDHLYNRGWKDRHKEKDFDPRGCVEWQYVLDLLREETSKLENKLNQYKFLLQLAAQFAEEAPDVEVKAFDGAIIDGEALSAFIKDSLKDKQ